MRGIPTARARRGELLVLAGTGILKSGNEITVAELRIANGRRLQASGRGGIWLPVLLGVLILGIGVKRRYAAACRLWRWGLDRRLGFLRRNVARHDTVRT